MTAEPKNQYQSKSKEQYRRTIWETFAKSVDNISTAKVLFFPYRFGDEIPIALNYGFKEENLIACEKNAAYIAEATKRGWHKQYPKIKCYANTLSTSIKRMKDDGVKLDAANIDLCCGLEDSTYADVEKLFTSGIVNEHFVLAWTLLKGRENRATIATARLVFKMPNGSVDRIDIINALINQRLNIGCRVILKREYHNDSKAVMCYGILETMYEGQTKLIEHHRFNVEKCIECSQRRWVLAHPSRKLSGMCKLCSWKYSSRTSKITKCASCGKQITVRSSRQKRNKDSFCSRRCYARNLRGKTCIARRTSINKVCLHCGKDFKVEYSVNQKGQGIFCSKFCHYADGRVTRQCHICGIEFESLKSRSLIKYTCEHHRRRNKPKATVS